MRVYVRVRRVLRVRFEVSAIITQTARGRPSFSTSTITPM